MKIDEKIRDEKVQLDINRGAAKISTLSSGRTDKYEFSTGREMLTTDQKRVIEQARFTYSPLQKPLEKQRKIIEDQGEKLLKINEDQGEEQIKSVLNRIEKNFLDTDQK